MTTATTKILITGGAGFIGSSLAEKLVADAQNYVVAVDDLSTGHVENLPQQRGNFRFIKTNVNEYGDISAVMLAFQFDYVFHYAACVGVQRTLKNPVQVLCDIDGIKNVLGLAKNTGVRRVFYSSSSEVYGEPVEFPQNEETTPLNSKLPYAVVKNVGESFLRSYKREYGLDFTIFRFFNTYGPRQSADFVMTKFIDSALEGRDITVYGDGSQSRTFCYIGDNVDTSVNALAHGKCVNEVVNIGNESEVSVLELAQQIVKVTGSRSRIMHVPPLPEGDMKRRKPDITRMRDLLGRELTPLSEGLEETIASRAAACQKS
jgi:UDP-glucuronate decarboxylase